MNSNPQEQIEKEYPRRHHEKLKKKFTALKLVFLLSSILIILSITLWPIIKDSPEKIFFSTQSIKTDKSSGASLTMENARISGINKKNNKYSITAKNINQSPNQLEMFNLEGPHAEMMLSDGSKVSIDSEIGEYNEKIQKLFLMKNVTFVHESGHKMLTESIEINIDQNTAKTESLVSGEGPLGKIKSDGFVISQGGKKITFKGNSRLIINKK